MDSKKLERAATRLLRKNGYTWSGRLSKDVNKDQCEMEDSMTRCPFRGSSRKKR